MNRVVAAFQIQIHPGSVMSLVLFVAAGAALAFFTAVCNHQMGLRPGLAFIRRHPSSAILSGLALAFLQLLGLAVTNRPIPALILTLFLAHAIALVDQIKYESALTHFLWSDLFKAGDLGKFRELIGHYVRPAAFLPILGTLAAGVLLGAVWPAPYFASGLAGGLPRLAAGLLSLTGLLAFGLYGHWAGRGWTASFLTPINPFDYDRNTKSHGFLLAFLGHLSTITHEQDPPADYGPEQAASVTKQIRLACALPKAISEFSQAPTIIVLAIEAFWDICRIPGISFGEDPLAAMRSDYCGDAQTTCFAGLTSNTEFEFLTSFDLKRMHDSACPFITVERDVPGLPAHLKSLGYRTIALHSYTRTFYQRDRVYPGMGFDQFLGLEELGSGGAVAMKGWYMADEALVNPVIHLLEKESGPQFIYALTVQNHGPYAVANRYSPDEIEPGAIPQADPQLGLSEADRLAIINYTQGVRDSAKLYSQIRAHCSRLDRPVILMAFGDHLPGLGASSGYRVFLSSGMAGSVQDPVLYQVPVFAWTNRAAQAGGLPATLSLPAEPVRFPALAPCLMDMAGLPLSPSQQLAKAVHGKYDPVNASTDLSEAYAWMQYDALWGSQWIKQDLAGLSPSDRV
jgi:phosphoglycerol transferase MdoB-like AlkP superfamily enzyme